MEKIINTIKQLGVNEGDVLFVSSDITRLIWNIQQVTEDISVNMIIDALQGIIGVNGTLIFPTYNWGFCKGETWNYHKTKCLTGALGLVALKRADFKRTQHPIYSFAVWGKDQDLLCAMTNTSSFGADSPFAYLEHRQAKNLVIDVPLNHCFTFVHYVEQQSGAVTYRYEKNFTAKYVDEDGHESIRTYSMFVRDLDIDVENILEPIEQQMLDEKVATRTTLYDVPITLIDLRKSRDLIMEDILNNRSRKICKYVGQ